MAQIIKKVPGPSNLIGFRASIDWNRITDKIGKQSDKNIRAINRATPNILRRNLKKALRAHPATAKYTGFVDSLKSELRPLEKAHVGSGLTFRFDKKTQDLLFRIILSKRKLGNVGFFTLLVASQGRKKISFNQLGSNFEAFGLKIAPGNITGRTRSQIEVFKNYSAGKGFSGGRISVPHRGDIAAVRAYHKWDVMAKKMAVKETIEFAIMLNKKGIK